MLRVYLILILASVTMAQVPSRRSCPTMDTMADFDINRYLGKWYEAERYMALYEFGAGCVTTNYSQGENGTIRILNKQISRFTGIFSSIDAIGTFLGRTDDPKMTVTFPSSSLPLKIPHWILDTDYKSYAVVWGCTDFYVVSFRNAWILTRERKPPVSVLQKAYQVLDKNNISRRPLILVDHKNCPEGH